MSTENNASVTIKVERIEDTFKMSVDNRAGDDVMMHLTSAAIKIFLNDEQALAGYIALAKQVIMAEKGEDKLQ